MAKKLHIALLIGLVSAAFSAFPGAAFADESVPGLTDAEAATLGEDVEPLEAGLYEVEVPGPDLITHGPDSETRLDARASAGGIGFQPGDAERNPVCGTDYFQHILYARPASAPDRLDEVRPQIQAAIRRMDAVLNQDALASAGVTADYKVLCGGDHQPRVDGFVSNASDFDSIVTAARNNGFDDAIADYTIFYDAGTNECGVGSYTDDERLSVNNAANSGGGYGVIYRGCWFTETPMHENAHAQGAIQYGAPNSTGTGGHCYDEDDVMCYAPDGGNLHQSGTVTRCSDRIHFDCGNDDYFDPAPEAGEYLSNHWNLGSPLNRFITFGANQSETPPASDPSSGNPNPVGGLIGTVTGVVGSLVSGGSGTPAKGSGQAAGAGGWRFFTTKVRRGTSALTVWLRGAGTANLDLYARKAKQPNEKIFACRSAGARSHEVCRITFPGPGLWYIGVRTADSSTGAQFSIRSRQTP